jgi:hypothetical protein
MIVSGDRLIAIVPNTPDTAQPTAVRLAGRSVDVSLRLEPF